MEIGLKSDKSLKLQELVFIFTQNWGLDLNLERVQRPQSQCFRIY
jgi:hypothetical protein